MYKTAGFFYEFDYYLLPENIANVKELEEQYGFRAFETVRYEQEKCMAPYVTEESGRIVQVSVKDYSLAFDTELYVMPQSEYDAKLRENIAKTCPSCHYYINDDNEALTSFYDEISYDNVCYRLAFSSEIPFFLRSDFFWHKFQKMRAKLENLLDKGKTKKARKVFEAVKDGVLLSDSYLVKKDGKYAVCFSAACEEVFCLMVDAVLADKPDDVPAQWEFYPYLKKGVYTYDKKITGFDMKKKPPLYSVEEEDERINLRFSSPKNLRGKRAFIYKESAYLHLAEKIGEDVLLFFCGSRGDAKKDEPLISTEMVARMFENRVTGEITEAYESLYNPLGSVSGESAPGKQLPFRSDTQYFSTRTPQIATEALNGEREPLFERYGFSYAYLYVGGIDVENGGEETEKKISALTYYLTKNVKNKKITATGTGITYYGSGVSLEVIMMDGFSFYEKLRSIAPVLKSFKANLVTLKGGMPLVYECDFNLKLAGQTLS